MLVHPKNLLHDLFSSFFLVTWYTHTGHVKWNPMKRKRKKSTLIIVTHAMKKSSHSNSCMQSSKYDRFGIFASLVKLGEISTSKSKNLKVWMKWNWWKSIVMRQTNRMPNRNYWTICENQTFFVMHPFDSMTAILFQYIDSFWAQLVITFSEQIRIRLDSLPKMAKKLQFDFFQQIIRVTNQP